MSNRDEYINMIQQIKVYTEKLQDLIYDPTTNDRVDKATLSLLVNKLRRIITEDCPHEDEIDKMQEIFQLTADILDEIKKSIQ